MALPGDGGEATSGEPALQLLRKPAVPSLGALGVLELKGAGLDCLPAAIAHCATLWRLDIGGNPLRELPEAVAALPRLRVLFASGCHFEEVPPVLARCPSLKMVGFNNNRLSAVDGTSLPEGLEWLIAASNQIRALPNISRLSKVRKLMLSHNELTCEALAPAAGIEDLEMVRAAANRLEAFPSELLRHPRLSWVAVGGNPFAEETLARRLATAPENVDFAEVTLGEKLGSGAGATVYAGTWRGREVAVKIWDGDKFSDGTAKGEWSINRVAGHPGHPSLVGVLGTFGEPRPGMVLEKIDGGVQAASPPTFAPWTVTRDVLPGDGGKGPRISAAAAVVVAGAVASACEYLHGRGVLHGDVYLHNTLVVTEGPADCFGVSDARLSDFGAAAAVEDPLFYKLEARSFGWLLQDLLELLVPEDGTDEAHIALLRDLRERCGCTSTEALPAFSELAAALKR